MATIDAYETAAGKRYRVRYRKPDHAQTDKRGFRTKREAELFLASVQVSMARGEFVDATEARQSIGPLGTTWLTQQSHLNHRPSACSRSHGACRSTAMGSTAVRTSGTAMCARG